MKPPPSLHDLRATLCVFDAAEVVENAIELCEAVLALDTFPASTSPLLRQIKVECPYRIRPLPGTDPARAVLLNFDRLPACYEAIASAGASSLEAQELELFDTHHVYLGGDGLLGFDWEFMPRNTGYFAAFFYAEAAPWTGKAALEAYVDRLRDLQALIERRGLPRVMNRGVVEA